MICQLENSMQFKSTLRSDRQSKKPLNESEKTVNVREMISFLDIDVKSIDIRDMKCQD